MKQIYVALSLCLIVLIIEFVYQLHIDFISDGEIVTLEVHSCRDFITPLIDFKQPCPVCYVPVKHALKHYPLNVNNYSKFVLHNLEYVNSSSSFGGDFSVQSRSESFNIKPFMQVQCGFMQGNMRPGEKGSGFEISTIDLEYLQQCRGIFVYSAIFGDYDNIKQPRSTSKESMEIICFIMFTDEETSKNIGSYYGTWRLVVVRSMAYGDVRYAAKIPKMLVHRIVPSVRFSIWIDGKLELNGDPIQIIERYLWRTKDSMAVPIHPDRTDVFEEAVAVMVYGRYKNKSRIDEQMRFYKEVDGLSPYNASKLPIITDVPESHVIIREHIPIVNFMV